MRLLLYALLIMACLSVRGATHPAATPALADVKTAYDLCADGDTLTIPAGSATWLDSLKITNKWITIWGAGIGSTVITDQNPGVNLAAGAFLIVNQTNKPFKLGNFTLTGTATAASGNILIGSSVEPVQASSDINLNVWFSYIRFDQCRNSVVQPVGQCYGLFDHCYWKPSGTGPTTGVYVTGEGDYGWDTRPLAYGTTNCIVLEDCVFDWPDTLASANGAVDALNGAHVVVRYSTITNINLGNHGTDSGGIIRSCKAMELYMNQQYTTAHLSMWGFRGGTGVIWSNNMTSGFQDTNDVIPFSNYRNSGTNVYPSTAPYGCCPPFGPVANTNKYDGQTDIYAYPAYDQVGRTSPTTYGATNTTQTSSPFYIYHNLVNGSRVYWGLANNYTNTGTYAQIPPAFYFIQEGRDVISEALPGGYVPLVYPHPLISGGSGVGSGVISIQSTQKGRAQGIP